MKANLDNKFNAESNESNDPGEPVLVVVRIRQIVVTDCNRKDKQAQQHRQRLKMFLKRNVNLWEICFYLEMF